ncbi:kinase-like domain-containing protein [Mucor mucedo]|uniref:kinase-like domain-containing protein n=1 Tax=Mucor mucedo TaxID=29922 RepID=UPI002220A5F7|nr:kinase-like domain-containing protein [Mucor mucedo]KAI7896323.1 kinase-like domain-containing protein [Mucor mucedo]
MPRWFNTLQLHRRWKQSKTQHKRTVNGKYKLLHEIGQGASGIVHLAVDTKTNVRYAIKELSKSKLQRQYHSELLRQSGPAGIAQSKKRKLNHHDNETIKELYIEESNLLKKLAPHENIIKFVEVIEDVEYNDSIFIAVMEYAENGIVMDVTPHSVTKALSDTKCRIIFKQLVAAVTHLHQNGIIHRDIKPQNLLLSNENIVKLIDFGNATIVTESLGYTTGTPAFMAPELLKKVQGSPTSADLWSMGVTLYCLAYGHLPFEKASLLDLYADIQNKTISHTDQVDPQLADLIDKLLEKNPVDRITLKDVSSHPWLKK